jgi:uncharacterized protein (DUF488 family)
MVAGAAPQSVYTIGHSNQSTERFLRLLVVQHIDAVVDIRSQPYSQAAPQFNHRELGLCLERTGIEYVFAGDTLGGRPQSGEYYDRDGHVLYNKVAQGDEFALGISRLKVLLDHYDRLALMCSEEDPTNCHRRLLVGRVLAEQGLTVRHIRGDGRVLDETEVSGAHKVSSLVQRGFFDDGEESLWRSTRSVLPAGRQRDSSSH